MTCTTCKELKWWILAMFLSISTCTSTMFWPPDLVLSVTGWRGKVLPREGPYCGGEGCGWKKKEDGGPKAHLSWLYFWDQNKQNNHFCLLLWFLLFKGQKTQYTEVYSFPPWLTLYGTGYSDWEQGLAISALACPSGQLCRATESHNWPVSWEEWSGKVGTGTKA